MLLIAEKLIVDNRRQRRGANREEHTRDFKSVDQIGGQDAKNENNDKDRKIIDYKTSLEYAPVKYQDCANRVKSHNHIVKRVDIVEANCGKQQ